ncbi:CTD small phosphatase-like protein 2-A [Sycon ciliatum]|uniref:CTD small phosphatase-like protein 2-A n=1 Tax=Sycon ciliatum TaxID=27933 RepID=UPI0031F6C224
MGDCYNLMALKARLQKQAEENRATVLPSVSGLGVIQGVMARIRLTRLTLRAMVFSWLNTRSSRGSSNTKDNNDGDPDEQDSGHGEVLQSNVEYIRVPGVPILKETSWNMSFLPRENEYSPSTRKYTLVFDLDETLMCSSRFPLSRAASLDSTTVCSSGATFHIYERPFLTYVLLRASKHFDIVVYTTMEKPYALKVVTWINRDFRLVKYLLHRDHCVQRESGYIKCLQMLGRDLRKTVLVDSSPTQLAYNERNGIHIDEWYGCPNDRGLLELCEFLMDAASLRLDDIRPLVDRYAMGKVVYQLDSVVDVEYD